LGFLYSAKAFEGRKKEERKAVNGLALNQKQEKFCLAYAKSGNARQSYLDAGYKCKPETADASASQLLKNPKVKERLAELYNKAANAKIADITEMQQTLTAIIRQQHEEEVIVCDAVDGAQKMKKTASIKDIINAINTLGKMQGAFVEKVEAEIDMDLNIIVDYGDGE
jgi:phage terminase small subunit